jgi:mersacidin/lichenicidin family type 2 lantibiotic
MHVDTVRAWKDPIYRESLSSEQIAALAPHPAGSIGFGRAGADDDRDELLTLESVFVICITLDQCVMQ